MKLYNGTKGILTAVIIFLALSTTTFAGGQTTAKIFHDRVVKNLISSMENELPSVVEGALYVALQVKDRYPNEDYEKLLTKLKELTNNGATISIRYKAQLASLFISYPDLFKEIKNIKVTSDNETPDTFFKEIASKVESYSLVGN